MSDDEEWDSDSASESGEVAPSKALTQLELEDISAQFERKVPEDDPARIAAAMDHRLARSAFL